MTVANHFDQNDVNKIIDGASKAGINKSDLEAAKKGDINNIMKKLKPEDAQKLQEVMNNKAMQEKLLSSPQVKEIMKKFLDKK